MTNWGSERAADYVRFVFANEPCERLPRHRRPGALGSDLGAGGVS